MKRLNKYLLNTTTVAISASLQAGVVYTDVDPDAVFDSDGDNYNIDFNGDGNFEFQFELAIQNGGYGYGGPDFNFAGINLGGGNYIAGYQTFPQYGPTNTNNFASVYYDGVTVGTNLNWLSGDGLMGFYFDGYGGGNLEGPWTDVSEQFISLKSIIDNEVYYGWARVSANADYSMTMLHDYAYNDTPDEPIVTGVTFDENLIAKDVTIADISNKHNGLDLEVSFVKAIEENKLNEYRLIAVKNSIINNFSVGDANSCAYYRSVTPSGLDRTVRFKEFSKDSDGDIIQEGVEYAVVVMSIPDFTKTTAISLSQPSNDTTLQSRVGIEESLFNNVNIVINLANIVIKSASNLDNVSVLNVEGKQIESKQNNNKFEFNLNGRSSGIYFIAIESEGKIETKKIIL